VLVVESVNPYSFNPYERTARPGHVLSTLSSAEIMTFDLVRVEPFEGAQASIVTQFRAFRPKRLYVYSADLSVFTVSIFVGSLLVSGGGSPRGMPAVLFGPSVSEIDVNPLALRCSNCGAPAAREDRVCHYCGAPFTWILPPFSPLSFGAPSLSLSFPTASLGMAISLHYFNRSERQIEVEAALEGEAISTITALQ
jgi:hypothetical protein